MTAALSGMLLSLSLIIAIGPQNAHVLRMGLLRSHVGLTVLACAATDVVLIAIGVGGLAQLGKLSAAVQGAMLGAAALFLLHYGWLAAQRVRANAYTGLSTVQLGAPATRMQAMGTALAFSWLNPHAWLDTAVLIGTASLGYASPDNWWFGLGAATGSALWFIALGLGAQRLAHRLIRPGMWRGIDAAVALTMWGTAVWLIVGIGVSL